MDQKTVINPWSPSHIDNMPLPLRMRQHIKRGLGDFPVKDFAAILSPNSLQRRKLEKKLAGLSETSIVEIPAWAEEAITHLVTAQTIGGLNLYADFLKMKAVRPLKPGTDKGHKKPSTPRRQRQLAQN